MRTVIDTSVTKLFHEVPVSPPPGFTASYLGMLTRTNYWNGGGASQFQNTPEVSYSKVAWPVVDDNILDWIILLEAVVDHFTNHPVGDHFTMIALGAGWGRWLVAGAFAVKQFSGNELYQLTGVEAEPTHFAWMQEHFNDNRIYPLRYILHKAAISDKRGLGWFYTGNPASWYGQSLIIDPHLGPSEPIGAEIDYQGYRARRVQVLDLSQVTAAHSRIDYLHMDIQGAELAVLAAFPEILKKKIKRIEVGTHSHEIETGLRNLFNWLGWTCQYDIPLNGSASVNGIDLQLGDGVQVWINPAL